MGSCRWPWEQSCEPTPQNCINPPNNCCDNNDAGCLFCEVVGANTCAEVMDAVGRRIAKRLHASVLVTASSTTQYTFSIRRGQSHSTVTAQVASNCSYPINATYTTRCSQTGSATFYSVEQFLSWVGLNIR